MTLKSVTVPLLLPASSNSRIASTHMKSDSPICPTSLFQSNDTTSFKLRQLLVISSNPTAKCFFSCSKGVYRADTFLYPRMSVMIFLRKVDGTIKANRRITITGVATELEIEHERAQKMQSSQFFLKGFLKRIKRYDKCSNVLGTYVEK
ncbi:hypothetical protein TNCV_2707941 [Trichonephila clavipes]|nr:hypothetical protein TNCV_2707941 [Trichonephila clavipes]